MDDFVDHKRQVALPPASTTMQLSAPAPAAIATLPLIPTPHYEDVDATVQII